jgi:hypothetical protein
MRGWVAGGNMDKAGDCLIKAAKVQVDTNPNAAIKNYLGAGSRV